ncbi:hypothetical protein [Vibrio navarrensis]|uniref:ParE family toxin-like protein n=1 Tax=Vibrio navarrensis TaxID=29495 RepID=UPI00186992C2|nr:hypothetical protein [Vibrio navarrensis]
MKIQNITNKQGVTMTLIITKAPSCIVNKAQRLILRLREHDIVGGMRPKVIQRDRRWLSYRINLNYRLLVRRSCCHCGPYYCVSHAEFDHWAKH